MRLRLHKLSAVSGVKNSRSKGEGHMLTDEIHVSMSQSAFDSHAGVLSGLHTHTHTHSVTAAPYAKIQCFHNNKQTKK